VKVLKFTPAVKLCKENVTLSTVDAALIQEPTHYPIKRFAVVERTSLCNFQRRTASWCFKW